MALKNFKPITPSLRQLVIVDRTGLWKGKPVKALTKGKSKTIDLPTGQITWRKAGGKLTIIDKDALAAWAVEQGPEAGLFRVKTEPEMRAIQALFAKTGELPPGTDFEPETETISAGITVTKPSPMVSTV